MGSYHKIVYSLYHSEFKPVKENTWQLIDYDIGLVKTETSMRIQSPIVAYMNIGPIGNGPFVVYGWGVTHKGHTETLNQMQVEQHHSICKEYQPVKEGRMICFKAKTNNQRVNSGDSGSPIILKTADPLGGDTVVSLITGSVGTLGAYQLINGPNISYFRPWIDSKTNLFDNFN